MRVLAVLTLLLTASAAVTVGLPVEAVQIDDPLFYAFQDGSDVWLGIESGGIHVANLVTGGTRRLVQGRGIPTNRTSCGVSAFGRIWLGSQEGLYVSDVDRSRWELFGTDHLPSGHVTCLASRGSLLWIGTSKGLASYDSVTDSWRIHTGSDGPSDSRVFSVAVEEHSVWVGSTRGGVYQLNLTQDRWRSWGKEDGLASNTVFCITTSPGHVFAGTTSGLSIMDRQTGGWTSYGPDHLPSLSVYSVLWVPELNEAWIGTGFGLSIHDPSDGTFETITKVGEIQLEKVNDLAQIGGAVWIMRATNLWFAHRTTGVVGYDIDNRSWLRPIVLEVLIDQSGYGPGHQKQFMVQSNEPMEGPGRFRVKSLAGREVFSGALDPSFDRPDWDAYYWKGDFTLLQRRGNFTVEVEIGNYTGGSHVFEIDNDVLIDECGELIYEFLSTYLARGLFGLVV